MENQTNNSSTLNIHELIKPYLVKFYWFLLSIIIFASLSIFYIKLSTPVYNIKSAVLIKDAKKSLGGGLADMSMLEGLSGFGGMSTNSIENELEVFKTKKLIRNVVSINHLQTSIYTTSRIKKKELFGDTSPILIYIINEKKNKLYPKESFLLSFEQNKIKFESEEFDFNQNIEYGRSISLPFANIIITKNVNFDNEKAGKIGNILELNFPTLESSASNIQKMMQVDLADKDATVINLSIDYAQTDKAKTIIKALIDSYNKDAILDKNSEYQKTKEFIDNRIDKICKELGNVESEKERFKRDNRITDLMTEAKISLESSADAKNNSSKSCRIT